MTAPFADRTPPRPLRILISTGEVSGDLQGATLVAALHRQAAVRGQALDIVALGGERMAQAGATLWGDTTNIGSVGIFEALPYLLPILALQRQVKRRLQAYPPDLAILIDYMSPNLVLSDYLHRTFPEMPVAYYIAPQQWVWTFKVSDTHRIVRNVDRVVAIFPEEARYYEKFGASVDWVGHPLLDSIPAPANTKAARQRLGISREATVVTLLPASRHQEITYLLPVMFTAAQQLQRRLPVQYLVPIASEALRPAIERAVCDYGLRARIVDGKSRDAIAAADVALTKSGTVNLEIALLNVPQVVVYRLNPLSAWIAYHILRFHPRYVSPVNLVEMTPVVPEFIQWQARPEVIGEAVFHLLQDPQRRRQMLAGYANMRQALGKPGVCDRAAHTLLDLMQPAAPPEDN
ncbi:Lipid-A-disaccharide synthase [Halomicronema hongdechloris C2206]|uniref:Lipid-A-disaccharide synthase n=1 Tax=Halomicronema hongdechloris C2206 TaxID=1641165 RepID=A0A1Z3HKQ1_9CYAN|nr:lipid-A-disaccharide synthase [Halomicronema hongdechloris]ASC70880.1 Lipid-A-disaccharide synthase [Halomicronema hongdechloris C2206]